MNYRELLEHSYEVSDCESRLVYLGEDIFDFTTYDSEMTVLFASKAVEVCSVINKKLTFEYIEKPDNYLWFLLMCNMPFFADRLEWGASIRGAWWGAMPGEQIEFQSFGLWVGDEQLADTLKFSADEWGKFIDAVVEFAAQEIAKNETALQKIERFLRANTSISNPPLEGG